MPDRPTAATESRAADGRKRWVAALVFACALLPFLRGADYPFLNLDDPQYVFNNPHVLGGLTSENARWALTTGFEANWHPLTWLSLQLDSTLFGEKAASGYRSTNLILHACNAALLFWVLSGMTGSLWRSAVAAGLFALHPLRVESVIWVTERKDVLSTFFWLLTMLAYLRYVQRPGVLRYLPVMASLALGLMAKPMLVTLPCVLLLLDYWPLGRLAWKEGRWPSGLGRLVLEKIPLLLVVIASSAVTYQVQSSGQAVKTFEKFSLDSRLANAILSAALYVWQAVWPVELAPFYPYVRHHLTDWPVLAAAGGLIAATVACVWWGRSRPYLPVGWFWYLGTLVPVIGIVQVGVQARADRYTYVPEIGLAILAAWGVNDALERWSVPARHRAKLAAGVLAVLAVLTWQQVGYWQSNVEVWEHTLQVTGPDNAIAQQNLGIALDDADRPADALPHLALGAKLDPDRYVPQASLAICLLRLGREEEAIEPYRAAVRINPDDPQPRRNLAILLARLGRDEEALPHCLALTPDDPAAAHMLLGRILLERQFIGKSRAHFEEAARLDPSRAAAHFYTGLSCLYEGRPLDAERPLRDALRLEPRNDQALTNLGLVLWSRGNVDEAIGCCQGAVAINPNSAINRANLAMVLRASGRTADSDAAYAETNRIDPGWAEKAVQFAWGNVTRGRPGVGLFLPRCQAIQACEATNDRNVRALMALAAIEAEEGQFPKAIELLSRARVGAEERNVRLAKEIDQQLQLYRAGKTLRTTQP